MCFKKSLLLHFVIESIGKFHNIAGRKCMLTFVYTDYAFFCFVVDAKRINILTGGELDTAESDLKRCV